MAGGNDPGSLLDQIAKNMGLTTGGSIPAQVGGYTGIYGSAGGGQWGSTGLGVLGTALGQEGNEATDKDGRVTIGGGSGSGSGSGSGGGGGGGSSRPPLPKSYTERTKSVDLTSPLTARKILRQTIEERIGRAPTAAEFQAFIAALNRAEKDKPTVRTTDYKLNETTQQYNVAKQTTSGGIDAPGFAEEYAEDNPQYKKEYGAYQAASTFFNALLQAIGAPGE